MVVYPGWYRLGTYPGGIGWVHTRGGTGSYIPGVVQAPYIPGWYRLPTYPGGTGSLHIPGWYMPSYDLPGVVYAQL